MTSRVMSRAFHPVTFLAIAISIYAASILIVGMLPRLRDADAVAVGVTCDLVLLVPALYYLLLVRGRGWPMIGLAPVFLAGVVAASWILPPDRQRLLSVVEWVAVPLELCVLAFIGWRAVVAMRRVRTRLEGPDSDAFTAIRNEASTVIGSPLLAGVFAQEIAAIYYAFFSWRTPLPRADQGFTSYRKNGYGLFLMAIVIALVIETVAVHLLLQTLWSAVAAWIFTALSVYGLFWMVGDFQALRLRTTTVTRDHIHVRLGTRCEVSIPRDALLAVEKIVATAEMTGETEGKPLDLVLVGSPDVEIRLSRPVIARRFFGLRRAATTIRLQIDAPDAFVSRIGSIPNRREG